MSAPSGTWADFWRPSSLRGALGVRPTSAYAVRTHGGQELLDDLGRLAYEHQRIAGRDRPMPIFVIRREDVVAVRPDVVGEPSLEIIARREMQFTRRCPFEDADRFLAEVAEL